MAPIANSCRSTKSENDYSWTKEWQSQELGVKKDTLQPKRKMRKYAEFLRHFSAFFLSTCQNKRQDNNNNKNDDKAKERAKKLPGAETWITAGATGEFISLDGTDKGISSLNEKNEPARSNTKRNEDLVIASFGRPNLQRTNHHNNNNNNNHIKTM